MKGKSFAFDLKKEEQVAIKKKKTIQCFSTKDWGISIIMLYSS